MSVNEMTDTSSPIIEFKDVRKSFGTLHVLKGINLEVERGEAVVLIGVSGSGKTTMLRCINFLEEYDGGEILVNGELVGYQKEENRPLVKRPHWQIAKSRENIGMVFQSFNLFPHKSVLENIIMAPVNVKKISKNEAKEIAHELLEKVGLMDKINEHPANLSGGQQQRVAIVRALAMQPQIMLFDEVTSALDPELVGDVLKAIKQLAKEGMTRVVVTHEMHFAKDVAHRVLFIDEGKIVEEGAPSEVLSKPKSERLKSFLNRFKEEYFL